MSTNIIPAPWTAGSFTANVPFDSVVNPALYYTVSAVRTVQEMLALKSDLFKLVWEPAGVETADYQSQLAQLQAINGAIICLSSKNNPDIYVPSTYIKSFPLVDGVIYEHMCIYADLGSVPPSFSGRINSAIAHFQNYLKDMVGISDPRVNLGTVQTRGYVPKEQADAWENTRQLAVKDNPSDLIRLEAANRTISQQSAYIAELEAALIAATKTTK